VEQALQDHLAQQVLTLRVRQDRVVLVAQQGRLGHLVRQDQQEQGQLDLLGLAVLLDQVALLGQGVQALQGLLARQGLRVQVQLGQVVHQDHQAQLEQVLQALVGHQALRVLLEHLARLELRVLLVRVAQ